MSAPNKEQFANDAQDILDGGINDSQTTIDLVDASEFPATGNFRVITGEGGVSGGGEAMLCTSRAGNTLTVVRGIEGTTPAAHGDGIGVSQILTLGGFSRWATDNDVLWGSNRPALGKVVADDGVTLLTASSFTSVNASGVTFTDEIGTILMRKPGGGSDNVTGKVRTAPSAPYSYIAGFRLNFPCDSSGAIVFAGLGFRKNSDGKLFWIQLRATTGIPVNVCVSKYNSPTSGAGNSAGPGGWTITSEVVWFKIEDDNTNLKFYCSDDGFNWIQIYSEARGTFITGGPDEIGFFADNFLNTYDALVRLVHWSKL